MRIFEPNYQLVWVKLFIWSDLDKKKWSFLTASHGLWSYECELWTDKVFPLENLEDCDQGKKKWNWNLNRQWRNNNFVIYAGTCRKTCGHGMFSILFTLLFIHMLAVLLLESPCVIIFSSIFIISVLFMLDTLLSVNGTKVFIYYFIVCMGLWILKCTLYQKVGI